MAADIDPDPDIETELLVMFFVLLSYGISLSFFSWLLFIEPDAYFGIIISLHLSDTSFSKFTLSTLPPKVLDFLLWYSLVITVAQEFSLYLSCDEVISGVYGETE